MNPITGDPVYLVTPAIISAADVATIQRSGGEGPAEASLTVNLTPLGATKLAKATAAPVTLAIEVNGTMLTILGSKSPLSNSFEITGSDISDDRQKWFRALTED